MSLHIVFLQLDHLNFSDWATLAYFTKSDIMEVLITTEVK